MVFWALTFPLQTIRLYHYVLTTVRDPTDGRRRRRTNDDGRTDVAPNTFFLIFQGSRVCEIIARAPNAITIVLDPPAPLSSMLGCFWSFRPCEINVWFCNTRPATKIFPRRRLSVGRRSSSLVGRSVTVVVRRSVGHRRRSSLFFETHEHLERSKRVLARDDGVTMTTVDGINIAYFQGPNSFKVLSNRRRSIYLRLPHPQLQCCK